MGTWGKGLVQGDSPLDYIYSQTDRLRRDIERLSETEPSASAVARLGAAIGLLLQCHPGSFHNDRFLPKLYAALERQRSYFPALPARARKVFRQILDGKGAALADRNARGVDPRIRRALGHALGYREPVLFKPPQAAAYAQEFAGCCVQSLDEELNCPGETWMDDLQGVMGIFVLLLLIEPCRVSLRKIRGWRKKVRAIYESENQEFGHNRTIDQFMRNVERAFEVALEKFST